MRDWLAHVTRAGVFLVAAAQAEEQAIGLSGVLAGAGPPVPARNAHQSAQALTPYRYYVTSCAHGFTLPKHHFLGKDTVSAAETSAGASDAD
jgi:hypothetical protein